MDSTQSSVADFQRRTLDRNPAAAHDADRAGTDRDPDADRRLGRRGRADAVAPDACVARRALAAGALVAIRRI
jgi:hypothetical protein